MRICTIVHSGKIINRLVFDWCPRIHDVHLTSRTGSGRDLEMINFIVCRKFRLNVADIIALPLADQSHFIHLQERKPVANAQVDAVNLVNLLQTELENQDFKKLSSGRKFLL